MNILCRGALRDLCTLEPVLDVTSAVRPSLEPERLTANEGDPFRLCLLEVAGERCFRQEVLVQ